MFLTLFQANVLSWTLHLINFVQLISNIIMSELQELFLYEDQTKLKHLFIKKQTFK